MHHGVTFFVVFFFLNHRDKHVVRFRPRSLRNLFAAVSGEVEVVKLNVLMRAFTELNVVIAGVGRPHIQEAYGVAVIGNPAVTGYRIVAVLTGGKEGVPFLVFERYANARGF